MIFVDTETTNEFGKSMTAGRHTLYFGVAEYRRYRSETEDPVIERIEFNASARFWEWVVSKAPQGSTLLVLAHNWNFDGAILEPDTHLKPFGYECSHFINDGRPPVIISFTCMGKGTIKIIDTLNYFTTSVAGLGKSLGHEKLASPGDDASDDEWRAYAWRDVEIIRDAYLHLRAFIDDNDLGKMPATLASLSMATYKYRFMHHDIYVHDRDRVLAMERESYKGGRVECFYVGETEGESLYKYDINSMYPTVMRNNLYSTAPVKFQRGEKGFEIADGVGYVADVLIETDLPIYPVRSDVGLIFPVGEYRTTLSTPELKDANSRGLIKGVYSYATYDVAPIFVEFVDYFYAARRQFQASGNAAFSYMAKILLNSLYGKFGQRGRRWEVSAHDVDTSGITFHSDEKGGAVIKLRNRFGISQQLMTAPESEESCPIIASEVTGFARLLLWQFIESARAAGGRVYYCDTDSVVTDAAGATALAQYCGGALGQLKLEGEATSAAFYVAKDYVFGDEVHIKGIRRPERGVSEYSQDKFTSWAAHLSRDERGFVDIITTPKRLTRQYKKAVGEKWVCPIVLENGVAVGPGKRPIPRIQSA